MQVSNKRYKSSFTNGTQLTYKIYKKKKEFTRVSINITEPLAENSHLPPPRLLFYIEP